MTSYTVSSSISTTELVFNASWKATLASFTKDKKVVIIIDETVAKLQQVYAYESFPIIPVPSGEQAKSWDIVTRICDQLLDLRLDRNAILVGIGGGVVTDLVGFIAAIFKRGIECIFVPTTILSMVDAAIGGKNGINVGTLKNMIGTIVQPKAIIYDYSLLDTLPERQWSNGFAEIIKHAAIQDSLMFEVLKQHQLSYYRQNKNALDDLIQSNVQIKVNIIERDPTEKGDRKLLNFGHTLAHAIEKKYSLLHGFAVSIGMMYAAKISAEKYSFDAVKALEYILVQYGLPIYFDFDFEDAIQLIQIDKKAKHDGIDFILLEKIGQAKISFIPTKDLYNEYHYTSFYN